MRDGISDVVSVEALPSNVMDSFTYRANDGLAVSNISSVSVTVNPPNQPPIATAGPDQTVNEDDTVTFDGSTSSDPDGTITAYNWDFGDGSSASGSSTTHVYTSQGTYTITLTVTDNAGLTDTDIALVTVNNLPPVANAGLDKSGNVNESITFDGSASTDTTSDIPSLIYEWSFGDGQTALGKIVTHSYQTQGIYTSTLTVTDNDVATASDIVIVTVNAAPTGPVGEGAMFSRNADFSTEDRDFVIGETLYVKFFSDQLDYNDLNQAEWQFDQADGNFVNHNDGFYTIQVLLTETVTEVEAGETSELEFQGVIQDNNGRELERQVIFMVSNNSPPSGSE